ncbi:MAG: hypothetical protein NPIRA03_06450 [Nitrospirales bacterium]|nr:MAG: hypothetical protein NPIRA03_06450 [Nitrospirales bacterium]
MVLGFFDPTTSLPPVLDQIRNQGIPDIFMEILSPLPLETALLNKPVRIPLYRLTIIGGIVGIGVGIFFAAGTALLFPLVTGGKPIVSIPVVGIISYETMMLMAIAVTFVATAINIAFVQQSGLRNDPRIDEGSVGLSIQVGNDTAKAHSISRLLQQAGASEVEIRTIASDS